MMKSKTAEGNQVIESCSMCYSFNKQLLIATSLPIWIDVIIYCYEFARSMWIKYSLEVQVCPLWLEKILTDLPSELEEGKYGGERCDIFKAMRPLWKHPLCIWQKMIFPLQSQDLELCLKILLHYISTILYQFSTIQFSILHHQNPKIIIGHFIQFKSHFWNGVVERIFFFLSIWMVPLKSTFNLKNDPEGGEGLSPLHPSTFESLVPLNHSWLILSFQIWPFTQ